MSDEQPRVRLLPPTRPGRTYEKPRCEDRVSDEVAAYRKHCRKDDQCERRARYEVDGKKLCKTHAGDAALAILLGKPKA